MKVLSREARVLVSLLASIAVFFSGTAVAANAAEVGDKLTVARWSKMVPGEGAGRQTVALRVSYEGDDRLPDQLPRMPETLRHASHLSYGEDHSELTGFCIDITRVADVGDTVQILDWDDYASKDHAPRAGVQACRRSLRCLPR